MCTELINILVIVHFIDYGVVSLGPVELVKEHSEYQCLFLVLYLNQFQLHSLDECEFFLLFRPE